MGYMRNEAEAPVQHNELFLFYIDPKPPRRPGGVDGFRASAVEFDRPVKRNERWRWNVSWRAPVINVAHDGIAINAPLRLWHFCLRAHAICGWRTFYLTGLNKVVLHLLFLDPSPWQALHFQSARLLFRYRHEVPFISRHFTG